MSKALVYTQAYNAEKTMGRTIESVLAQTFGDFSYYILDNGSLDTTGAIIKSYADRDKRITPLANASNNVWELGNTFLELLDASDSAIYFCMLDADDEYKPDFLNATLAFTQKHQLEIAVCGSDFIGSTNGVLLSVRALEQDLILEGEAFGTQFTTYHQFSRTFWGKLYRASILQNWLAHYPDFYNQGISYGIDTIWAQSAFLRAKRVGILAGSLHKYYVNTQSISYSFDAGRARSDRVLFDAAKNFLLTKVGHISPENEHFLYSVYLNAIRDTLQVLMTARIPDSEKMEHVQYLKGEMDEIQRFFATLPPRPPAP